MARTIIYRGCFVHTPEPGQLVVLDDHLVTVKGEDGIIESIVPARSPAGAAILLETSTDDIETLPTGSFSLPTWVDTHIHAPQYLYVGTALDKPLLEWLEAYAFKAEQKIDSEPELLGRVVYRTLARRLLECGTTCVAAYGTVGVEANIILAQELGNHGICGFVGKVQMDRNCPSTYGDQSATASMSATQVFLSGMAQLNDAGLIKPILTPRFIPTCSDELLVQIASLAKSQNLPIQTHACESIEELTFSQSLTNGTSDVSHLAKMGLIGSQTLLAHCTHINATDFDIIKLNHTSIAHCPLSNIYFSSKPFMTREALDSNMKVGLGSDIAGGYRLDLMDQMLSAVSVSRIREGAAKERRHAEGQCGKEDSLAVTWKESLYLATLGGARALNLDHSIGTFEVGKFFDAQLIQPQRIETTPTNISSALDFFDQDLGYEERIERWWCCGDRTNRARVWTRGTQRWPFPNHQN